MKTTATLAALLAIASPSTNAAGYSLEAADTYPIGYAAAVVVGDVNGDGREDIGTLATRKNQDDYLLVHIQDTDGGFAEPIELQTWINNRPSLAIVDVNSDGIDDIVSSDQYGLSFQIWEGGSLARLEVLPELESCHVLATADVDGDGNTDLACHQSDAEMELLYLDGDRGILSTTSLPSHSWAFDMDAGDLNDDGHPDLVVVVIDDDFLVYYGNGESFDAPVALPRPSEARTGEAVAVGDFDGDGLDDFVISGPAAGGEHAWLYRQTDGGLAPPVPLGATVDAVDLRAGDLDGDGDTDLVSAGGGQVGWFLQAHGALGAERRVAIPPRARPGTLAIGDLDTDGCHDVVVAHSPGGNTTLPQELVVLHGDCPDPASDLDGDFRSDLFWRNVATGDNVAWRGADQASQLQVATMAPHWAVGGLGDYDGDHRDDVLWRNTVNGLNQVWSAGDREARVPILNVLDTRWAVAGVGDLDGDDKDDVVWRHRGDGRNQVWLSANARSQQRMFAVRNTDWRIAGVADFDDDGEDDLLWHNPVTGANTIWRSGNPKAQDNITDITDLAWDIAGVGDFDGDGRGDILWRHAGDGRNVFWRGGQFDDAVLVRAVADPDWQVAAVGDYDGDGQSDIVWRHARSGRNSLWRSADPDTQLSVTNVLDTKWGIAP